MFPVHGESSGTQLSTKALRKEQKALRKKQQERRRLAEEIKERKKQQGRLLEEIKERNERKAQRKKQQERPLAEEIKERKKQQERLLEEIKERIEQQEQQDVNFGDLKQSSRKKLSSIVDSKYCVPHDVHFHIGRKSLEFEEYSFIVTDESGMINWQIIMYDPMRYNSKFLVHDNEGKIIMTVHPGNDEFFGMSKFKVYKGDSTDEKDFLFSMKRPWGIFWKCDLEGYLPSTKEEKGGFDFEAVGFWFKRDFVVKQKGGHVLAEGYFAFDRWFNGSQNFNVIVSSNVDYAFMVAVALMYFDTSSGSAKGWLEDPEDIDSDTDSD